MKELLQVLGAVAAILAFALYTVASALIPVALLTALCLVIYWLVQNV